jgi:chromosome segregation ATPase
LNEIKTLNEKILVENDDLIDEWVNLKNQISRIQMQSTHSDSIGFYKEQIGILEHKNEILQNKVQTLESCKSDPQEVTLNPKNGNQVLYARFEETNAALERAFERISALETENNRLVDSINAEKHEKVSIKQNYDKVSDDYRRMHEEREKVEMEKIHTKEHLRVNNEHVERIKQEKQELERKVKQTIDMKNEMSKILDEERNVYRDSKRLFEDELKTLKQTLSSKVSIFRLILGRWGIYL